MKKIFLFGSFLFFASLSHSASHTTVGTEYGVEGSQAYAQVRHGPDGALFLDPYFIGFLKGLKDKTLLDAGCGAAPWAIYAAQHKATVYGIDIQSSMISQGEQAIQDAGLKDRVFLQVGDVAHLPYPDEQFDAAISINVGCNLPGASLGPHIQEMARVLKPKGKAIVTAPASLDIVFHAGIQSDDEVLARIDEAVCKSKDVESFMLQLKLFSDVHRATFVQREKHFERVSSESALRAGEAIWRKLPGLVVPNHYHSEQEYLQEFAKSGLKVVDIHRPRFACECEREAYNEQVEEAKYLGSSYVAHNPFVIFVAEK